MASEVNTDGGPAFPIPPVILPLAGYSTPEGWQGDAGMSLRDWFAGQALNGLLASSANPNSNGPASGTWNDWALQALAAADAMLAARSKESQ